MVKKAVDQKKEIMAHPNIDERRQAIRELLDNKIEITPTLKRSLMKQFNCSHGAIKADLLMFLRPKTSETYFVSPSLKVKIFKRDGSFCQYCADNKPYEYIIEHVIPASIGGVGRDFNLVVACQKCNTKKRNKVWKPNNFHVLAKLNKEWANKIENLAVAKRKGAGRKNQDLVQLTAKVKKQTRAKIDADRGGVSIGKFLDEKILSGTTITPKFITKT